MKAKLFFLTLLLSSAISSLQAGPMWEESKEGIKVNEEQQAELRQAEQQRQREATDSVDDSSSLAQRGTMPQGGGNDQFTSATAPVTPFTPLSTTSSKKETPKLTPEQGVRRVNGLLAVAFQKNDPNAKEWGYARARIRMLKEWSQNIITPPPQAPIDWLMSKSPEVPTSEEVGKAKIIQAQALALEAALPAWKKSAIAVKAIKEFSRPETAREETIDCWAFWRKAPTVPDSADQVFQKATENQQAWKEAADNFLGHINQLPEDLKNDVMSLLQNTKTSDEVNTPLAQAWAAEVKHLEQRGKAATINPAMESMPREVALKILRTSLASSEAQGNVDAAMAAYEKEKNEARFNSVNEAIDKLEAVSGQIEALTATEGLPPSDRIKWTASLQRLAYITTVYRANLVASSFWAAYDERAGASVHQDETLIRDRDVQPTLTVDSLEKGRTAIDLFTAAIAAKKALFSERSQMKFTGLELDESEVLTSEEEAAEARIAELQREIDAINSMIPNQNANSDTERDDEV